MTFGEALELLKKGEKVFRKGWWSSTMWIHLQVPSGGSKMTIPYIYIKTEQGDVVPWVASQEDLLDEDWILFEEDVDVQQ